MPLILAEEKKRLNVDKINFLSCGSGWACSFLNLQDNRCKIYARRPFECRLYPFLINKKDKDLYIALDPRCPFSCNKTKTMGFEGYLDYLVNFFKRPSVLNAIRVNQKNFHSYPSPEVLNLRRLVF